MLKSYIVTINMAHIWIGCVLLICCDLKFGASALYPTMSSMQPTVSASSLAPGLTDSEETTGFPSPLVSKPESQALTYPQAPAQPRLPDQSKGSTSLLAPEQPSSPAVLASERPSTPNAPKLVSPLTSDRASAPVAVSLAPEPSSGPSLSLAPESTSAPALSLPSERTSPPALFLLPEQPSAPSAKKLVFSQTSDQITASASTAPKPAFVHSLEPTSSSLNKSQLTLLPISLIRFITRFEPSAPVSALIPGQPPFPSLNSLSSVKPSSEEYKLRMSRMLGLLPHSMVRKLLPPPTSTADPIQTASLPAPISISSLNKSKSLPAPLTSSEDTSETNGFSRLFSSLGSLVPNPLNLW